MPWIAIYENEKKGPWQVPRKTDVGCPTCGGRMRVWSEASDGRARHFKHIDGMQGSGGTTGGGGVDCESVAESDEHLKWKNLAAQRLATAFDVPDSSVSVEKGLDAPKSAKDRRVGDVVLIFPERDPQLGNGIIVEVQHKNESKDIEATTADYIGQDFSVVWVDESDFAPDHCRLGEIDFRHRAREAAWPNYAPDPSEWRTEKYSYQSIQENWQEAYQNGLSISGSDAILPPEWVDETSLELWRDQYWPTLFRGENAFGRYGSEQYITEVQKSLGDRDRIRVSLPPEVHDTIAKEFWNRQPWASLFSGTESRRYIAEVRQSLANGSVEMTIDFDVLVPREKLEGWWMKGKLENQNTRGNFVNCPNCGKATGGYKQSMSWASKTCRCGTTFTIDTQRMRVDDVVRLPDST